MHTQICMSNTVIANQPEAPNAFSAQTLSALSIGNGHRNMHVIENSMIFDYFAFMLKE